MDDEDIWFLARLLKAYKGVNNQNPNLNPLQGDDLSRQPFTTDIGLQLSTSPWAHFVARLGESGA